MSNLGLLNMQITIQSKTTLLDLPSEIRKEIYRHLAVFESAIHVATNNALYTAVKLIPGLPALTFVNRSIYDEVKSIYYEENAFTFRRNALQYEALRELARKHSRWINRITDVEISKYFYRRNSFRCELDFSVRNINGKFTLTDLTEDVGTCPISDGGEASRSVAVKACLCEVSSLARTWQSSLMAFVEACSEFEWTWKEEHAQLILCKECGGLEFTRANQNMTRQPIFMPSQKVD